MKASIPRGADINSGPGGPIFNPRTIFYGMLSKAPYFLLNSVDSIILGIIAAYVVLMIFLGGSNFFYRAMGIALVVGVAYGLGRGLRFILYYSEHVPSFSFSSVLQNGDKQKKKQKEEEVDRTESGSSKRMLSPKTRAKNALSVRQNSNEKEAFAPQAKTIREMD